MVELNTVCLSGVLSGKVEPYRKEALQVARLYIDVEGAGDRRARGNFKVVASGDLDQLAIRALECGLGVQNLKSMTERNWGSRVSSGEGGLRIQLIEVRFDELDGHDVVLGDRRATGHMTGNVFLYPIRGSSGRAAIGRFRKTSRFGLKYCMKKEPLWGPPYPSQAEGRGFESHFPLQVFLLGARLEGRAWAFPQVRRTSTIS